MNMVVFFECPQCACECACTEFQSAGAIACEHCGRRVLIPRWAAHKAMAGDSGERPSPRRSSPRPQFPDDLIATPQPLTGRISRHIERIFGPCPMVFHQRLLCDHQLDIHLIPPSDPSAARACFTFATSGLSCAPPHRSRSRQTAGPGAAPARPHGDFCELILCLPADWPGLRPNGMCEPHFQDPANAWPLEWLKAAAAALMNASPPRPGAIFPKNAKSSCRAPDSPFTAVMLLPSAVFPKTLPLFVDDDFSVSFLALWPLYPEELRLARRRGGIRELIARFKKAALTELIDKTRPNVARQRP